LHSRKVVGYAVADHLRTSLIIEALAAALLSRRPPAGVIFHSDSEYVGAGGPGLPDPHSDGHARMLVPGCSRAS
jgi:hypothetical protein